jgi:aryl-alcohol dehydrogenase-like predicted oxidoreductase
MGCEKVRNRFNKQSQNLTDLYCSPHVSSVILGATKPQQIHDNCKALQLLDKLTPEVMEEIEGILQNKPKA